MVSIHAIPKFVTLYLTMLSIAQAVVTQPIELASQPLNTCLQVSNGEKQILTAGPYTADPDGNRYQAQFDTASWSGSLKKWGTVGHANNSLTVSGQVLWDAAKTLNNTRYQNRQLFTYSASSLVPFKLNRLSDQIREIFNRSPESGQQDNLGPERINYLSGDRTLEVTVSGLSRAQFRTRSAVLGDIINSIPVYKGPAANNILDKNYPAFFNRYKNREGALYIGANDGMLHAFSATDGSELFAYIPSPLLEKMPALTSPAYQHDAFADGKISVGEAQASGSWLTVLAAGMGSGARGVFALDVTAPASFITGHGVLFEFTAQDDADMGFVTAAPVIAKLPGATNSDGTLDYRYFVLVPSGYNASNTNGDNFLFLLSLDKPAQSAWTLGKNYYKIKTGSGKGTAANALAGPGLVLNLQGAATLAYAGDLQGQLWRFDFSNTGNPAAHAATLIFNAWDARNHPQPITVVPLIAYAPGGGYAVLFGTGKYVEKSDTNPTLFSGNSFYAFHDQANQPVGSRGDLASRSLTVATGQGKTGYRITGTDFNYGDDTVTTKKGWFIDFPNSAATGERMISEAAADFGSVFFNTLIPARSCQKPDSGKSYKLDLLTGKTADPNSVTGIQSPNIGTGTPVLLHVKSELGMRDALGQHTATHTFSILNFNTDTDMQGLLISDTATLKSGRQSWRELSDPGM